MIKYIVKIVSHFATIKTTIAVYNARCIVKASNVSLSELINQYASS